MIGIVHARFDAERFFCVTNLRERRRMKYLLYTRVIDKGRCGAVRCCAVLMSAAYDTRYLTQGFTQGTYLYSFCVLPNVANV